MSATNWEAPPANLAIHPSEVHIWRAGLQLPDHLLERLAATLSPDEQQRAFDFRFERHRNRFIAARGILRRLIGQYLSCGPSEIQFGYGAQGKPRVTAPKQGVRLCFNIAHSGDLALFAFCIDRRIGTDLERRRQITEMPQLVSRNFSARESATWHSLPQGEREAAFFSCWVRKEAFIKAIGEGMSYPLKEFDVSLLPDETAELLAISGDARLAKQWSLLGIAAGADYAAAAVVEGGGWQPRLLQYD